eukprot:SAG22_NODE_31_length_27697_cov_7.384376_10_plen_353_part_00
MLDSKSIAPTNLHPAQSVAVLAMLAAAILTVCQLSLVLFGASYETLPLIGHIIPGGWSASSVWGAVVPLAFAVAGVGFLLGPSLRELGSGKQLRGADRWHFFISHYQATGGDQAARLWLELKTRGFKVWYDNDMDNLTADGMAEGVRDSACFVLFMSAGVFTRPYVQFEIAQALSHNKPILLLHETDDRHGRFDFRQIGEAPEFKLSEVQPLRPGQADRVLVTADQLRQLGAAHESIGWERRDFKLTAVLQQLVKRFEQANAPQGQANAPQGGLSRTGSVMLLKAVITAFPSVSLPLLAVPLRSQRPVALRSAAASRANANSLGARTRSDRPIPPAGAELNRAAGTAINMES